MKRTWQVSLCALFLVLLSACGTTTPTSTAGATATAPAKTPTTSSVATPTTPAATPTPQQPSAGKPVRLLIPDIRVDSPIEQVDVLASGELSPPQQNKWDGTGWYQRGPRPGETGSAVIVGHLDRPGGSPAVFWDLRQLHEGSLIKSVDEKGVTTTFRVTRVATYAPKEAPLQEIFGDGGGKYLNLITCAGDWIPDQKQTTLRLVVYSTRV